MSGIFSDSFWLSSHGLIVSSPLRIVCTGDSWSKSIVESRFKYSLCRKFTSIKEVLWVVSGSKSNVVWEKDGSYNVLVSVNSVSSEEWVYVFSLTLNINLSWVVEFLSKLSPVGSSSLLEGL